jgi:hypothetical protein
MNLLEFVEKHGTEHKCRMKFKRIRDKAGVTCKRCKGTEHYWLNSKQMYQCKTCRFRTSLRSGTMMEASNLPFRYWYIALYFMTRDKKSVSAHQIQRELGHRYYQPIFEMMHKIRVAMGIRDEKYLLSGEVEVDEGFFETLIAEDEKDKPRKRGRGSQKQTMAMVFAQTERVANPRKNRPSSRCRYFKMVVCPEFDSEIARTLIEDSTAEGSKLISDGLSIYMKLRNEGMKISAETTPPHQAHKKLPWVHAAIGNFKRVLHGIHHHSEKLYIQNYMNEFCWKLNRRYFGKRLFERGLVALTLT